jgi:uncharacterized protein (DUF302 family)
MNEQVFIRKKSSFSVNETMYKLESIIKEKKITVFAKIDHHQNAKDINIELNESLLILFGNPKIGTMIMQENIFLSYDLPLKIAIVKDDSGDVWVVYNKVNALKEKYNLSNTEILEKIDNLMDTLTDLAIK